MNDAGMNEASMNEVSLNEATLLALTPGSYGKLQLGKAASRRGLGVVVNPETGQWAIVDSFTWQVFCLLRQAQTWLGLQQTVGSRAGEAKLEALLTALKTLSRVGVLSINGKSEIINPNFGVNTNNANERLSPGAKAVPRFIALHMTGGCNMHCAYCYNNSDRASNSSLAKKELVMSGALAEKIIARCCQELPASRLSVDFLGGEPLLVFETIVEIIRRGRALAKRHNIPVDFLLQTNGLLLDERKIRILQEEQVGVGVSLDGPAMLHDRYRRDRQGQATQQSVLRQVELARKLGLAVTPLAVISEPEDYLVAWRYFVEELGFRAMRFNSLCSIGRARDISELSCANGDELSRGFLAMVEAALSWARHHGPLKIYDLCHMLSNLASSRRDYMCMRSPCGIGQDILAFAPNGNVYACEEYEEHTREALFLGSLDDLRLDSLDRLERVRHLRSRRVENIPKCSRCYLRRICGGGCTHRALASFHTLLREAPLCRFYECTYAELMWKIHENPDIIELLG